MPEGGNHDGERPSRHRAASVESTRDRGVLYRRIKWALMPVLFVSFLLAMFTTYPEDPLFGIPSPLYDADGSLLGKFAYATFALCILATIILAKKSSRHMAPRYVELESPPGVLYLRPFTQDTDLRFYASWGRDRTRTGFHDNRMVHKYLLKCQFRPIEPEEMLAELTEGFGNMAAIGEPESPPILGADNVYVSDDNWQDKVLALAKGAKLVILTAGTTPGVIWETENVIRTVPPSRLLLNIPGRTPARRRKHYAAYREAAEHMFPRGLPPRLKTRAITFAEDWAPVEDVKPQPPPGTSANVAWWMARVLS